MKVLGKLLLLLLLLLLLMGNSACTYRSYPTKIPASKIDQAVDSKSRVKIDFKNSSTIQFKLIVKSDSGYYGLHYGNAYKPYPITVEKIETILIENPKATVIKSILINTVVVPVTLYTIGYLYFANTFTMGDIWY